MSAVAVVLIIIALTIRNMSFKMKVGSMRAAVLAAVSLFTLGALIQIYSTEHPIWVVLSAFIGLFIVVPAYARGRLVSYEQAKRYNRVAMRFEVFHFIMSAAVIVTAMVKMYRIVGPLIPISLSIVFVIAAGFRLARARYAVPT